MKTVVLLGADDPEMQAMEKLLVRINYSVAHALISGTRVNPGNAYKADPVPGFAPGDILVRIECEPLIIPEGVKVVIIDHHRPGDPGYSSPPVDFWAASSIGQLYAFLQNDLPSIRPTEDEIIVAAMDHCFPAAIRGECPGVSAKAVFDRKLSEISKATKANILDVEQRIHHFTTLLAAAPLTTVGQQTVTDLRSEHLGEGYSLDLLSAQVAVTISGKAALLRHCQKKDMPETWSLSGNARPDTVVAFMEIWAPAQGLKRIYGAPSRGYAGGYVA